MDLGFLSYLGSALAFGFFAVLLLFGRQNNTQGKLLLLVVIVQTLWAIFAALFARNAELAGFYHLFESLRYAGWYLFFFNLLELIPRRQDDDSRFLKRALVLSIIFVFFVLIGEMVFALLREVSLVEKFQLFRNTGHILMAIIGLAVIEQLYRNTAPRYRWAVKYMYLSIGGIFAFDLYLYSQAFLFNGIDRGIWEIRGIINVLMVPLLVIAVARNKAWSRNIFISRHVVLSSTTLLGAGVYLLLIAASGFYLRESGGDWGQALQIVFFSLALVLLTLIMMSGQVRAHALVFIGKHFYRNKYDYRNEWLRLTKELDESRNTDNEYEAVIQALANIVGARGGQLWQYKDNKSDLENVAVLNASRVEVAEPASSQFISYLDETGYIINLNELVSHQVEYRDLEIPGWVSLLDRPWLIVPLISADVLTGFVVLVKPLVIRSINWEDRDLLKTAANQTSSYLTILKTSKSLAMARQFEVFNRLSAYMVHDLKNVAAELQLVGSNAVKHGDNPEFVKDAFDTVSNAAGDIQRLLEHLRGQAVQPGKNSVVDICELISDVISIKKDTFPAPIFESSCTENFVLAEKGRLQNVLLHLIENAQQATSDSGYVKVGLENLKSEVVITIADNGTGMDEDFIKHRLFNPFDTTKGNAGMGIGMYESREYMLQLGGEISVLSTPGEGTVIKVRIPAIDEGHEYG
jgi:putative PEP-CTERM system histidine kinase